MLRLTNPSSEFSQVAPKEKVLPLMEYLFNNSVTHLAAVLLVIPLAVALLLKKMRASELLLKDVLGMIKLPLG
jgi:hypothetical protein